MDKVKKLIEAGASIPFAIRESLGMTLSAFAAKYGFATPPLSETMKGARRPTPRVLAALVEELGGTEDEWRELLWLAGKPTATPSREAVA